MFGGTISKNTAYAGGGVCNNGGTFVLSGGKISGNEAIGNSGGGVHNSGDADKPGFFTMSGGEISGNTATANNGRGGGVRSHGFFTMIDGKISGNTAFVGGGVYQDVGDFSGIFDWQGGVISGNIATGSYGGSDVYPESSVGPGGDSGGVNNGGDVQNGGFSLKDVVIICVGVGVVVVGLVVVVLLVSLQKRVAIVEENVKKK